MVFHAYIMASASGVLYTGVTNHLERRVAEHKRGSSGGFAADYKTRKLVYFEPFNNARSAISREKQWKAWRRAKKTALIESVNREWADLSVRIHRS